MASGAASAAEVRWKPEKFVYQAQGKNLKEFLREFGASQGLMVVVAPDVEGTVNGKFNMLPENLIEMLGATFGFIWYYDGNVLHVYSSADARSEIVRISNSSVDRLRQALQKLDIPDRRFPITYDNRANTALVSGPKRYVELVQQTARAIDQNQNLRSGSEIRVFPLRYAWANDFTYTQGGRDLTVPGVATALRRLYNIGRPPGPQATVNLRSTSTLAKLRGLGLNGIGTDTNASRGEINGDPEIVVGGTEHELPQFMADGRMNAVLVRDLPERMASHEAAIRALDTKPGLVEIEVRMLEVNSDAVESLGVDWRLRSNRTDLQVGRNLPSLSWGTALADGAPRVGPQGVSPPVAPSPTGVLTTVLGDAGRNLIARVTALQEEGRASMLSTPKVMTLDNTEAVLENLSTFFVRVAGNLDVDLFNVSAGTSMRVTPLIVQEVDQRQIKLAIRIEDGVVTGQTVDQIPVVQRSTISTQSLINDGQALLIAGYAQESSRGDDAGVPGLSSIPYLGRAFKYSEKRKTRVDRFFLLTPRVVTP
ncbi:MAG: type III secretion system outer membrane ring subunit SctC [Pseudomonadota bacterium]